MPMFTVETVARASIREFWLIDAPDELTARESFGQGDCAYDEVLGDEEDRTVDTIHADGGKLGNMLAVKQPDMLRLLRAVLGVCDMSNPDHEAFADSAADCLQELLLHEAEIRQIVEQAS